MWLHLRSLSSNAKLGFRRSRKMAFQPARVILLLPSRFKVFMVVLCNRASESDVTAFSFMLLEWRFSFSSLELSNAAKIAWHPMSVMSVVNRELWRQGSDCSISHPAPCDSSLTFVISSSLSVTLPERPLANIVAASSSMSTVHIKWCDNGSRILEERCHCSAASRPQWRVFSNKYDLSASTTPSTDTQSLRITSQHLSLESLNSFRESNLHLAMANADSLVSLQ